MTADGGDTTRAFSGRDVSDLTVARLAADELSVDDVRIHPETLQRQALVAEQHHNRQLAANFRRAAELALVDEAEVLAIYEALRPSRSSNHDLVVLAARLDGVPAPLCAALVREAALVYARRGLLRPR